MARDGRGGSWNRAGRRSGGARAQRIAVPRVDDVTTCPECANDACPAVCTRGCKTCSVINDVANLAKLHGKTLHQVMADYLAGKCSICGEPYDKSHEHKQGGADGG